MTGMLVVDTDVLIDVQRGHAGALTWFAASRTCHRSRG